MWATPGPRPLTQELISPPDRSLHLLATEASISMTFPPPPLQPPPTPPAISVPGTRLSKSGTSDTLAELPRLSATSLTLSYRDTADANPPYKSSSRPWTRARTSSCSSKGCSRCVWLSNQERTFEDVHKRPTALSAACVCPRSPSPPPDAAVSDPPHRTREKSRRCSLFASHWRQTLPSNLLTVRKALEKHLASCVSLPPQTQNGVLDL